MTSGVSSAFARLLAWAGAAQRGPSAIGRRARNRVIMRRVGRVLRR
ncbi:MAG TPA: hypothetical protein VGG89_17760 [Candidatus Baltobacteraceae bacterium]